VRVFIVKTWRQRASKEDVEAFDRILEALDALQISARDEGDPIIFHATSAMAAESILETGSTASIRRVDTAGVFYETGLYFGTLSSAVAMSMIRSGDGMPVILAARASELLAAGRLYPDINIVESGACRGEKTIWSDIPDPMLPDISLEEAGALEWEQSLMMFGTVACAVEGPIAGLKAFSLDREFPDMVVTQKDDISFGL